MGDHQTDHDDWIDQEPGEPGPAHHRRPRRGLTGTIAAAALGGFALIVWYAYDNAGPAPVAGEPPVVRADTAPLRVRPEQPGGLVVPHQDRLVLQQLAGGKREEVIEQILPLPEQPMPRPVPPPAVEPPPPAADDTLPELEVATAPIHAPPADAPGGDLEIVAAQRPASVPVPPARPSSAPTRPSPPPPAQTAAAVTSTPPAAPPSGGFRVQMASVRSEADARAEWGRLKSRFPQLLGALDLNVQRIDLGPKGTYYRVQAGPLSEAAAGSVCAGLKAQKTDCIVVRP